MKILLIFFFISMSAAAADVAGSLHQKIDAAGIPINGVSLGKHADKSTWRVDFKPTATPEQRAQATQIIAEFDPAQAASAPASDTSETTLLWIALAAVAGVSVKTLRDQAKAAQQKG